MELLQIGGTNGVLEDGREPANPVRELKPAVAEYFVNPGLRIHVCWNGAVKSH